MIDTLKIYKQFIADGYTDDQAETMLEAVRQVQADYDSRPSFFDKANEKLFIRVLIGFCAVTASGIGAITFMIVSLNF